jgi:hypothetical protein
MNCANNENLGCSCSNIMTGKEFAETYSQTNMDLASLAELAFKLVVVEDQLYKDAMRLVFALEAFAVEFDKQSR